MTTNTKTALIVPPNEGRELFVLGHSVKYKLGQAETNGDNYVFEALTPAGVGIPPHVHQHEDEVIYIIDGEYEIFFDGKKQRASAGAILHFPRRIPHGFQNVGAKLGRTLWVVNPGANFERFFEEINTLPRNAPPDMNKVVAIFKKYDIEILQ